MGELPDPPKQDRQGFDTVKLWEKHEDIAMHFNDLLMRLRTQALASVAALSTLVGVFVRTSSDNTNDTWTVAALIFFGLSAFWVAIWVLDLTYYNKLLQGVVRAIGNIEVASRKNDRIYEIQLSAMVSNVFLPREIGKKQKESDNRVRGVWAFYIIVFIATMSGAIFSLVMRCANG